METKETKETKEEMWKKIDEMMDKLGYVHCAWLGCYKLKGIISSKEVSYETALLWYK